MRNFETSYQRVHSSDEDEDLQYSTNVNETIHLMNVPKVEAERWNHIEDLDGFFTRVYKYHQRRGFKSICLDRILQILKLLFIIFFATFLYCCVNYDVLFANKMPPHHNVTVTDKVTLGDVVYDVNTSLANIRESVFMILLLIVAAVFFIMSSCKTSYDLWKYYEISLFYEKALHIKPEELENLSWEDVQAKLKEVQETLQMCINSQHINELDIHNRILRHKNYYVAMVNKELLPPRIHYPFIGEAPFWTHGLKFNMDLIFFKGPWAAFEKSYQLHSDYKRLNKRPELIASLKQFIFVLGITNLALSPFVLIWQLIYTAYSHVGLVRQSPETFSLRHWSLYGRQYLRHFNELDHKFDIRLSHAYGPGDKYMKILTPSIITILCEYARFYAAAIFGVAVTLTMVDEDVLRVEHMFMIMSVCAALTKILTGFIPTEYDTTCPEQEMRNIVAHIHYIPENWRGTCHTSNVRNQFSELFQMRAAYIIEQLISPIMTPLILLFWLYPRVEDFVKFFHNFTVKVDGVGDVCSFALLDVRRHGDPQWNVDDAAAGGGDEKKADHEQLHKYNEPQKQAKDGKTELSLLQFHISNPHWQPRRDESRFLAGLEEQATRDVQRMTTTGLVGYDANPLMTSQYPGMMGFQSINLDQSHIRQRIQQQPPPPTTTGGAPQPHLAADRNRGGRFDNGGNQSSMYHSFMAASMQTDNNIMTTSARMNMLAMTPHLLRPTRAMKQMEMSASALYMHEVHQKRLSEKNKREQWVSVEDNEFSNIDEEAYKQQHESSGGYQTLQMFPSTSATITFDGVAPSSGDNGLTREALFSNNLNTAPGGGFLQQSVIDEEDELPPQDFPVNNHDQQFYIPTNIRQHNRMLYAKQEDINQAAGIRSQRNST